jgi:hypothetical protein
MQNAPAVSSERIWTAGIRAPRSTTYRKFRTPPPPPRLSTFKRRGGGGPESGAHLSNGHDHSARINGARGDSGPPPAFLPLSGGGGGPESGVHLPDGRDLSAQINGARAIPSFSAALCLTNVGPSPSCHPLEPPFPCCHVSSVHLPAAGPRGPSLIPSSTHRLPCVPLFPRQSLAKSKPIISHLLPLRLSSSAM